MADDIYQNENAWMNTLHPEDVGNYPNVHTVTVHHEEIVGTFGNYVAIVQHILATNGKGFRAIVRNSQHRVWQACGLLGTEKELAATVKRDAIEKAQQVIQDEQAKKEERQLLWSIRQKENETLAALLENQSVTVIDKKIDGTMVVEPFVTIVGFSDCCAHTTNGIYTTLSDSSVDYKNRSVSFFDIGQIAERRFVVMNLVDGQQGKKYSPYPREDEQLRKLWLEAQELSDNNWVVL